MKILVLSLLLFLSYLDSFGQKSNIPSDIKVVNSFNFDSAYKIIEFKKQNNQLDLTFFNTYKLIIKELTPKSAMKAIIAGNECLLYAQKANLGRQIRDAYHLLGTIYWEQGVNDRALDYFKQSLDLSLNYKEYEAAAFNYSDIGNIYFAQNLFPEARQFYWNGIKLANSHENELFNSRVATTILYSNIGLCYKSENNNLEALKYFQIAFKTAKDNKIEVSKAICLRYIGAQYVQIKDIKNALNNYYQAIEIFKKLNLHAQVAETYHKIGNCYTEFGDYDKALEIHLISRKLLQNIGYSKDLTDDQLSISNIYFLKNKYYEALREANLGLYLSKVDGLLNNQLEFYLLISKIYEKSNDFKLAFYNYKKFTEVSDSIFNSKIANKTASLNFKMEIDRKNQELEIYKINDELQNKTTIYLVIIIFLVSAISIIFIYLYNERNKTSIRLKESEQMLNELNLSKDKFFTIIAHDLKSPISALRNIIELMVDSYDSFEKEDMVSILNQMNSSSKSVYNLLENLLLWARIQTGRIAFNPETVNLNYLINENINLLKLNLIEKSIKLTNSINQELFVNCDISMIQTVIRNLISNAIKFTPEKGNIDISFTEDSDFVTIEIKDSGVGMNYEVMKKIFRIDVNHTTLGTNNEKGTGLGLAICKDYVEMNGGKIWVKSNEGKGTSFFFNVMKNKI